MINSRKMGWDEGRGLKGMEVKQVRSKGDIKR